MKTSNKTNRALSVVLAGAIQTLPLVRAVLPVAKEIIGAPPAWACVLRLATSAVAMFGYHAVSRASSIAISPANATIGVPYSGTASYSGGHAAAISGFRAHGVCLTPTPIHLFAGLTISYTGGRTAQISGTPTNTGTFGDTFRVEDFNCAGGHPYNASSSLVVGTGTGNTVPNIVAPPASLIAPVGTDVEFSVGASGNPTPKYYWSRNAVPIPGGTNSSLALTNVSLASAGLYSVIASNSAGASLPATCWLTVCVPAGTNFLEYNYTNHTRVGLITTMYAIMTNNVNATNTYKWQYNLGDITSFSTNGNTLTISAGQATVAKSGVYTIVFNSTLGGNTIVNQQLYDSYWAFGAPPVLGTTPQATNVLAGANVSMNVSASVAASFYGSSTPLAFLWYRNATNLVDARVFNSTNLSASLSLTNVAFADAGNYTVVVTNFWGSVTSAPAALTLTSPSAATNINYSVSNGTLSLMWPPDYLGWILQSQTNTGGSGIGTNWFDWPGSAAVIVTNISINQAHPSVFFRLKKP